MQVKFVACSLGVSLDQMTGNLTLFNVIEKLMPPSFPLWLPLVTYSAIVRRRPDEQNAFAGNLRVLMGGQELFRAEAQAEFTDANNSLQIVMGIQGIPVQGPGDLEFRLSAPTLDREHVYVITVFPAPPRAEPQAGGAQAEGAHEGAAQPAQP